MANEKFKLVRDNIPEIILASGKKPITQIATGDGEYASALAGKLMEEIQEFLSAYAKESSDEAMLELADVLEVIEAICQLKKYQMHKIKCLKKQKKQKNGGFKKRILLYLHT